jgi:iodotyrosine deiodinase
MHSRARDFRALMQQRRTVRDFSSRPVPRALIEDAVMTAASAPSGANQQPWTFVCIGDAAVKAKIRVAAEEEERTFYEGRAGDEWLEALAPLGTDWQKPFLETAPWLIACFGQRYGIGAGRQTYQALLRTGVGRHCDGLSHRRVTQCRPRDAHPHAVAHGLPQRNLRPPRA